MKLILAAVIPDDKFNVAALIFVLYIFPIVEFDANNAFDVIFVPIKELALIDVPYKFDNVTFAEYKLLDVKFVSIKFVVVIFVLRTVPETNKLLLVMDEETILANVAFDIDILPQLIL